MEGRIVKIYSALTVLIITFTHGDAKTVTVESYQKDTTTPATGVASIGALFTGLYLDGVADGLMISNLAMFNQVLLRFRPSDNQLKDTRLFCPPPKLALTSDNYKS